MAHESPTPPPRPLPEPGTRLLEEPPDEKGNAPPPPPDLTKVEVVERSKIALLGHLLLVIALFDGTYMVVAILLLALATPAFLVPFVVVLVLLQLIKAGGEIYYMLAITLKWIGSFGYMVGHHLVIHRGIVTVDEKVYELNNLRTIAVEQGVLGRWFNYGDIMLTIAQAGVQEQVRLVGIADPRKYEKQFEQFLGKG